MPRRLTVFLLAILALLPNQVFAAAPITFSKLEIDLWPEYDRSQVLVIQHISLDPKLSYPATIALRIPSAAGDIENLAYLNTDGTLISIPTHERVVNDPWLTITFQTPLPDVQMEYYDPQLIRSGQKRAYAYEWPGDYAVSALQIQLQEPKGSSQFTTTQDFGEGLLSSDGLVYHVKDLGPLPAGQSLKFDLTYLKPNDDLSLQSGKVAPSAPITTSTQGRASLNVVVIGLLALLAILILIGAVWWYINNRSQGRTHPNRKRHVRSSDNILSVQENVVFCHHCGRRAAPGDVFCRTCGTRLKNE